MIARTYRGLRSASSPIVILAATLASYSGNLDGNLDLYHEGERLAAYDALRAGALPFRDIYIPHGLGEDVLKPLAACSLFGESVEALRRVGQNSYIYRGILPPLGLAAMLLAALSLVRDHRWLWALAPLSLMCLYEITERHTLGFLAAAAIGMFIRQRHPVWLGLAGAASALAALYSLEVGAYLIASASGWLLLERLLPAPSTGTASVAPPRLAASGLAMLAGLAVVAFPFFAWCVGNEILADFFRNVTAQLFLRKELYPAPYPTPVWDQGAPVWPNIQVASGIAVCFYLIPLLYAVAVLIVLVRRRTLDRTTCTRLLFVALLGGAFWITVVGRSDFWHIAAAVPAFLLFSAVFADVIAAHARGAARRTALAAPIVICIATLVWVGQGGVAGRVLLNKESVLLPELLLTKDRSLVAVDLPRLGNVRLRPDQAGMLVPLVGYVRSHTSPDDTLLDLTDQGLLYFLCERRSASRYHYQNYCNTPDRRNVLLDDVLSRGRLPRYVLRYTFEEPATDRLGQFVNDNYTPETSFGYTGLMRLKEPPP